jgi:uncharacterized membrane-anchored protein YhcB (DUF1043 family)
MGLLDNLMGTSFDDPRFAATTQLAQGLLSSPRLMQGLAQGLGGYQQAMAQAKQAKMLEEMRQMQMAQQRMQMEAAQKEQARKEGIEQDYRDAWRTPEQMAVGTFGPTRKAKAIHHRAEIARNNNRQRQSGKPRQPDRRTDGRYRARIVRRCYRLCHSNRA